MRQVATAFYFLGWALIGVAGAMFGPLLAAIGYGEGRLGAIFVVSGAITAFAGGALVLSMTDVRRNRPGRRDLFLLATAVWLVVPAFVALPYVYGGVSSSVTDAYFEAASGITTTGATIFAAPETLPKSILLWRSLSQWLGGLATVIMVVGLYSLAGMAGVSLFDSAVYYRERRSLDARFKTLLNSIGWSYGLLTMICFVALAVANVPPFEAFCLALGTLSTGGFMPSSGTIGIYGNRMVEFVLMVFMIFGAVNMTGVWALLNGRPSHFLSDPEKHLGLGLTLAGTLLLAAGFAAGDADGGIGGAGAAVWNGLFMAVSALTTTGYESAGVAWGLFPALVLMMMAIAGGGYGSTAGGVKLLRVAVLLRQAQGEIVRLAHPHGVVSLKFGGRRVEPDTVFAIWTFFCMFLLALAGLMAILAATGLTFAAAWSVAIAALANAGPLAFTLAGAEFNGYGGLSDIAKWAISMGMVAGRLELFPIVIVFTFFFWRHQ